VIRPSQTTWRRTKEAILLQQRQQHFWRVFVQIIRLFLELLVALDRVLCHPNVELKYGLTLQSKLMPLVVANGGMWNRFGLGGKT